MTPHEQSNLDSRLIEAASNGNTATLKALLATDANVHAADDAALRAAASNGHTETVQVLLASCAGAHANDDYALRWAAKGGYTETVRTLLAAGANVHATGDYGLRYAALCGHTETVKVLLANGASVRFLDDEALRRATSNGHTETVQVLARHIFAPESWRGKSRAEIEAGASALYDKIKADIPSNPIKPEYLRQAASILRDCALDCWFQVRPAPPKIQISPFPAQPRPV
jgi:hypothetical protein